MSQRPTVIIGNWKMNKTIAETRSFISGLALAISEATAKIGIAVPFTSMAAASQTAQDTLIKIGAQNISDFDEGAYTGEISCKMIQDAGASFALIGHSERRRLFHEDDALVNRKIKKALEWGVQPVFCIGETLEEHQSGKAYDVLSRQMSTGLKGLEANQIESLLIAYEPVWAIGTNKAATPDIVQETHAFCRAYLACEWGERAANRVVIQYGGSVSPANADVLMRQPDVDGLLVGGASLSLDAFTKIMLMNC